MLRIGYVRLQDAQAGNDSGTLRAMGCHVVRAEEPGGQAATMESILDFIGDGDELVVTRIEHLGATTRAMLDVVDRLEARGASLFVLEPEISTQGQAGVAFRAVLEAVARLEPPTRRRRSQAALQEIRALQRAGIGPVEIARRLGVSRMTVWRKLKAVGV